jgi:pheromone shutdown-related protein TraB
VEAVGKASAVFVCTNKDGANGRLILADGCGLCRNYRTKQIVERPVIEQSEDLEIRFIPLTRGKAAIVDAEDYEILRKFKWHSLHNGKKTYAYHSFGGKNIGMHRIIMQEPKGFVVDHIDGNGLNNTRRNLRVCTWSQNQLNSRPRGKTSRYKGVCRHRNKWLVSMKIKGKNKYIGCFDDEIEAAKTYDRAAKIYLGSFAYLNFLCREPFQNRNFLLKCSKNLKREIMTELQQLPQSVEIIQLDGKEIYLVGTAHLSKQSVEDVRAAIQIVQPNSVCVELCGPRYKTMTDKEAWRKMDIFKIIRDKKAMFLLAQLIVSSFYRKLGERIGIQPGAEMLEAIEQAKQGGAELVLADREIEITLKRVWGYLGMWNKMKMLTGIAMSVFSGEEIDEKMIEQLKKGDQLEIALAEFTKKYPEVKRRLIDERDIFLSQKIRRAAGPKVVAVVGAGHIAGIKENIQKEQSIDNLLQIPPKSVWGEIFKWGIPLVFVALFAYGFWKVGWGHFLESLKIWVLVTGSFAAAGAAVAFGHPLAILTAFVAAPIMTLHPLLATGWFAGLVEAYLRRPTVEDFEKLPDAITTFKGFWGNHVTRILLVVAFSNLGAMLGSWIAAGWILKKTI